MYYVYIMTNKSNTVVYTGVTGNLFERVLQHKNKLVYYEEFEYIYDAISREKQLKNWKRSWKIDLIKSVNKDWEDLSRDLSL